MRAHDGELKDRYNNAVGRGSHETKQFCDVNIGWILPNSVE